VIAIVTAIATVIEDEGILREVEGEGQRFGDLVGNWALVLLRDQGLKTVADS